LFEADEAIGLARAASFDIRPGHLNPRFGWDDQSIGSLLATSQYFPSKFVTVKNSDAESDDEMGVDDPLWNDPSVRNIYSRELTPR